MDCVLPNRGISLFPYQNFPTIFANTCCVCLEKNNNVIHTLDQIRNKVFMSNSIFCMGNKNVMEKIIKQVWLPQTAHVSQYFSAKLGLSAGSSGNTISLVTASTGLQTEGSYRLTIARYNNLQLNLLLKSGKNFKPF